ncbi:dihydrofolate reductase family protein [Asanoa hainanensis]|uniref:dihydrofolate reductase family protein n=1 Tax=Asanoa hainanensis TaxID=560556 RepID=UPI000B7710F4|nr:dihydrofolate reductase family protein [Asanoa hainanensis]
MRKLTYYVAASIDGFIADPDGRYDFFPIEPDVMAAMNAERPETIPTPFRARMGIADEPNRSYDTVLMGRHSYLPGLEMGMTSPYSHLRQYVFSRTLTPREPEVEIVAGDARGTVKALKSEPGGLGIWLCGGGRLASQLLPEIDELVIKQYPLVLGAGIPLFADAVAPTTFALAAARSFASGAVVLTYTRAL